MKSIPNKTTKNIVMDGKKATYADLAMICLKQPPEGGFSLEEMNRRLKVLGVLENANASIVLEDADMEALQKVVNKSRWPELVPEVTEFAKAVNAPTDVALEVEKKSA